jgi:hypothetical protein
MPSGAALGDGSLDNPCNVPLNKMKGPYAHVTFENGTQGDLSLYLYIYTTPFGCGIGHVSLTPGESVVKNVPQGCYDFYGWVSGPRDSTPAGYGCLKGNGLTVVIRPDDIVIKVMAGAQDQQNILAVVSSPVPSSIPPEPTSSITPTEDVSVSPTPIPPTEEVKGTPTSIPPTPSRTPIPPITVTPPTSK